MQADPIVSIITPSFNRAHIIHETAESIFKQTYPHWEWVITDDGSTDNSWDLLEAYAARDSRVKIFKRERKPKGACACRNISVEKCTGDFLIFLDTDDLLADFCLEHRVKAAAENPECDFIIFPMLLFKKKRDDLNLLWNIDSSQDEIERILEGNPVCQGTGTLWKKKSFIEIGMWDEKLLLWQDIELHLRTLLAGLKYKKRMDLPPDVFLRISVESLSRTGFHSLPKLKSRAQVYRETAERVIAQNKLNTYKKGLRSMGADLIVSSANSGFFNETNEILQFSEKKNIITKKERGVFSSYIMGRKWRFYKLPFINSLLLKGISSIAPKERSMIGTVQYSFPGHVQKVIAITND